MKSMLGDEATTDDGDTAVNHALEVLFSLKPPERTFNAIFSEVFSHQSSAQKMFARWVKTEKGRAGEYAHIFNAGAVA